MKTMSLDTVLAPMSERITTEEAKKKVDYKLYYDSDSDSDDPYGDLAATVRDLGHDCPFAGRYYRGRHHACPKCDDCDYGQSIDTSHGYCEPCWADRKVLLKEKYPDYCATRHKCSQCQIRLCEKDREEGVCYLPGFSKAAKAHLKREWKNVCPYCINGMLGDQSLGKQHTGFQRALEVYREANPTVNLEVPPEPYTSLNE